MRFIHFALFDGTLLSLHYYAVDTIVLLIIGALGFQYRRARHDDHANTAGSTSGPARSPGGKRRLRPRAKLPKDSQRDIPLKNKHDVHAEGGVTPAKPAPRGRGAYKNHPEE